VRATEWTSTLDGVRLAVDTPAGRLALASPLIGEHNVMNLLAAVGVGWALGLAPDTIARTLGGVQTVPGRFEQVRAGQPFLVVVDYAHTPDALERVLTTARKITSGRLGVVFGCGGDRDRRSGRSWARSPPPGRPRVDHVGQPALRGSGRDHRGDRRRRGAGLARARALRASRRPARAIASALAWARPGDTLVIAGKGHETYQIVGTDVLPFDDREVARRLLSERAR